MKALTIILMLVAAAPLCAQTSPPPVPILQGNILTSSQLPPVPNGSAQVQQAIERMVAGIPKGREVLSMDLDTVILSSAAKSIAVTGDLETGKLLSELKSIQIRGFEIEGAGPEAYRSTIQTVRDVLKDPLWVRYATHSSAQGEMEIWSGRSGNTPTGVLLLSLTGKQVFIMNVAGSIRPDQLISLSGMLGIPNFNLSLGRN